MKELKKKIKNKVVSGGILLIIGLSIFSGTFFLQLLFVGLALKNFYEAYELNEEKENLKTGGRFKKKQRAERKYTKPKKNKKTTVSEKQKLMNKGKVAFLEFDYDEAISCFLKVLDISASDPAPHFNLACCYSLIENGEKSLEHLNGAIVNGFDDFEKIKTHDALSYLRIQPEYESYVDNGYKFAPRFEEGLLAKLERLQKLRTEGVLSELEFVQQKERLLKEQ